MCINVKMINIDEYWNINIINDNNDSNDNINNV